MVDKNVSGVELHERTTKVIKSLNENRGDEVVGIVLDMNRAERAITDVRNYSFKDRFIFLFTGKLRHFYW